MAATGLGLTVSDRGWRSCDNPLRLTMSGLVPKGVRSLVRLSHAFAHAVVSACVSRCAVVLVCHVVWRRRSAGWALVCTSVAGCIKLVSFASRVPRAAAAPCACLH